MATNTQKRMDFEGLSAARVLQLMSPDEIFANASPSLLSQLSEDRRIERKQASEHVPVISEYISMWANTKPEGGLIAVGMLDDGSFSGCASLPSPSLNNLEKAGRTHCPDASLETNRVSVKNVKGNDDFVVLFRVTGARWHAAKKHLMLLVQRGVLTHVSAFSRHSGSHFVLKRPSTAPETQS